MPTSLLLLLNLIRLFQGEPPTATDGQAPTEGVEGTDPGGGSNFFLMLIALVAVFYFVMIRPEKKNRQKREQMLSAIKKGDRVMTTSGMYGKVVTAGDEDVKLEVADGVRIDFNRAAIQSVITDEAKA